MIQVNKSVHGQLQFSRIIFKIVYCTVRVRSLNSLGFTAWLQKNKRVRRLKNPVRGHTKKKIRRVGGKQAEPGVSSGFSMNSSNAP